MSRIGKKPVPIPEGVKVEQSDGTITVRGPKGELTVVVHPDVTVEIKEAELHVAASDDKEHKALHGLWRALLNNMIRGVAEGYQKRLEIVGVGYRAEMKGSKLQLQLGYSHPIVFAPPEGIKIETPAPTNITVGGIDRQLVGQVAAKIRSFRPPEPYKGKGIKYEGEYIRRKAGKAAAAAAGAKQ
jgi:large subunit ribosomal protein L6